MHNFKTGDIIEAAPVNEMDQQIQTNERDIAAKADKVAQATSGNFAGLDANGNLTDSGSKASDFLTQHQDISGKLDKNQGSENSGKFMKVGNDGELSPANVPDPTGKADKVANATSGNFAGLDANGNLTDSGSKASDFLTSHQDISGKADKVSGATNGNFASLDSNGNLLDSGHKHSDYLTEHQDISGKLNVSEKGAANGVAGLDGAGKVPRAQLPISVTDDNNGNVTLSY